MATTTKRAVFPFTEQEPFLGTDHRYYAYVSGVGAGKTHGGMQRTWHNMERWNAGDMGAIVAPTTTMIKDVILPLMREAGLMDRWEYKSMHTDEPGIHSPNGSRALILSADNRRTTERLRGLNLAWFWLDEASQVSERAFEILTQRLRVGDYQNGFITTTPQGKNYLYDFFVDEDAGTTYQHGEAEVHEHGAGDRLALLRVPTWANPFTGDHYKADMRAKEGQVYEQDILGRFVDFEGRVYPWFDDANLRAEREANIHTMAYGVDWGHTNPFAIAAWAWTNRREWVCVDEVRETGLDYDDMVDAARQLQADHKPGPFYCGPDEPAAITMFKRAGLDAMKAENAVLPGLQYVSSLRDNLYVVEECQQLINEFNSYHYDAESDSEKPVEVNDHLMDATRYALFTHAQRGGVSTGVVPLEDRDVF